MVKQRRALQVEVQSPHGIRAGAIAQSKSVSAAATVEAPILKPSSNQTVSKAHCTCKRMCRNFPSNPFIQTSVLLLLSLLTNRSPTIRSSMALQEAIKRTKCSPATPKTTTLLSTRSTWILYSPSKTPRWPRRHPQGQFLVYTSKGQRLR